MNIKQKPWSVAKRAIILIVIGLQASLAIAQRQADYAEKLDFERTIAPYFTESTKGVMTPDADGVIRRWLLLEPINKPNRTNTVFTESYLRNAFDTLYHKTQFTTLPTDGEERADGDEK